MNQTLLLTQESCRQDRFVVVRIEGCQTMFVLHADHSICIASTLEPVTTALEPANELLADCTAWLLNPLQSLESAIG